MTLPSIESLCKAGLTSGEADEFYRLAAEHTPATAMLRVIAEIAYGSKRITDAGLRGSSQLATIRRCAELLAAPRDLGPCGHDG